MQGRRCCVAALHGAALVLGYAALVAHVATQIWRAVDAGGAAGGGELWKGVLVGGVVAGGVVSGACVLLPLPVVAAAPRAAAPVVGLPLYPLYVSLALVVATRLALLPTFTTAFALSTWVLYVVDVGGRRGLVHYAYDRIDFAVSRATFYATLRAASQAAVVYAALPAPAGRLLVLGAATAETLGMLAADNNSYGFSTRSVAFASYALLKSALFVATPLAEEWLLAR